LSPRQVAGQFSRGSKLPQINVSKIKSSLPSLARDSAKENVYEVSRRQYSRTVDRVVSPKKEPETPKKVAMDPQLSRFVELNLARLSEGKGLEKIAKRTKDENRIRNGRILGSLAGIPIGTAVGVAADRNRKYPLVPFMGMAAGQVLGGEMGARLAKKSSDESIELLRARIKEAGALMKGFNKAMSSKAVSAKNIAKAGIIGTGALGLYAGYKGVGAARDLAKPYASGMSQPSYLGTGRPFR
jgi:hypothetical protein